MHWFFKACLPGAILLSLLIGWEYCCGTWPEIHLAWDANTEEDLAGYKVYYGYTSGGLYDGTGLDQGDSPIIVPLEDLNDPANPDFILTGMDEYKTYYIVVTAYDLEGLESDYSNEVFWFLCHAHEDPPVEDLQSGCFISTLVGGGKL